MQSGLDEMRRTLREKEPQLPSTMITSLQRTELTLTAGQRRAEPPKLISANQGRSGLDRDEGAGKRPEPAL
jgi:hypothetical protein